MRELVRALEAGLVVAVATESFFGLCADATSSAALDNLLRVKPRGAEKGIPLVMPDASSWSLLVPDVPPAARALADALWPGALSIALPARPELDRRVTLAGSVAVRVPAASPAAELTRAFGKPLTATSANMPGDAPATDETAVAQQLGQAIASGLLVVLSGKSPGGLPSTLVDVGLERSRIVREGRVPRARVAEVLAQAGARLDDSGLPS